MDSNLEYKMNLALKEVEHKVEILDSRLGKCEQQQETIEKLVRSVDRLSMTIEGMTKEQTSIKEEVASLKSEPLENYKHYRRTVITGIITALVGAIMGALIALIFKR